MNERTKMSVGTALLIIGAVVVLLYALPASTIAVGVPVPLAILAAVAMAAGTLLVGTSGGTV